MQRRALFLIPFLLGGCVTELDYQGIEAHTYTEKLYPKVNTIELYTAEQVFEITSHNHFTPDSLQALNEFVATAHPDAVERLIIITPSADEARNLYITRQLRGHGFKKRVMEYAFDDALKPSEIMLQMDYSVAVAPDCPDWRKSPGSNYSNNNFSNMGCATVTNLGRQVGNPKHLMNADVTYVRPDATTGARAISTYHGTSSGSTTSSASTDSGSSASGSAATVQ